MWTYLQTWIVQDGELPELRPGSVLTDYGLRVSGRTIDPIHEVDGIELLHQLGPRGFDDAPYYLTGVIEWSRPETWEWIIRCNDVRFIAHLSNRHPAPRGDGARVSLLGDLAVIPEYEWLSFGLPSVRQNWTVEALKIEYRSIEVRDGIGYPTDVVEVEALTEMHQWADEREGLQSSYLLDLSPTP